jgi:NAD(P)-dependent dehydrogenase (short-subunit alcohol dehydrogenase family)
MARDTCDSISHGKEMAMRVLDRFRLDGKRLFVTGGSRGLGREMALAIADAGADAGADAVLVGRDLASLEKTAIDVRALGRKAWTIQGDAGIPAECERICRTALEEFGPIDILINNVGGRRVNIPTQDMPLDTWLQMLDLNLTSTFLCTKLIGGAMVARGKGGRIINIASINALVSNRGIAGRHYETAKAAVLQFTRATAADWAPLGITVNAILPGGFMTDANLRWVREAPAVIETFKTQIPMGDLGKPEDLGPLAVYLASDASRYMTGAALVIDGGYTLW